MSDREWLSWSAEAFARAAESQRPVSLLIENAWCAACPAFHADVLSDDDIASSLHEAFVPLRVDGDRMPHVQDRYLAAGWPTLAFLTPTGEVLWAAAAPEKTVLLGAIRAVATAWRDRRAEFAAEIARRRRAFEASRGDGGHAGLVRRDAARAVLLSLRTTFDPHNGGFGAPPRFPPIDALELLLQLGAAGDADALHMATLTLDGLSAGAIRDTRDGGFFRYALAADWTQPRFEKVLDTNAGLLRAFALGAALAGRQDWRDMALHTIEWVHRDLALDGLWSGCLTADDDWYAASDAERARRRPPAADRAILTDRAAGWIAALADAGRLLDRVELRDRAESAFHTLFERAVHGDRVFHFHEDGEPHLDGLLDDVLALMRACRAIHEATGDVAAIGRARHLARILEDRFWNGAGGFHDHDLAHPLGALRDHRKPFLANSAAALELLLLARATGDRGPRAMAERTLALFSKSAPRYGPDAARFVLAVNAFFEPADGAR